MWRKNKTRENSPEKPREDSPTKKKLGALASGLGSWAADKKAKAKQYMDERKAKKASNSPKNSAAAGDSTADNSATDNNSASADAAQQMNIQIRQYNSTTGELEAAAKQDPQSAQDSQQNSQQPEQAPIEQPTDPSVMTDGMINLYLQTQLQLTSDMHYIMHRFLTMAMQSKLPEPWTGVYSEESGVYFYNSEDGTTSWTIPQHDSLEDLMNNFKYVWDNEIDYYSSPEVHHQEVDARVRVALEQWMSTYQTEKARWQEFPHENPAEGEADKYFFCEETQETSWEDPKTEFRRSLNFKYYPLARLCEAEFGQYLRDFGAYYAYKSSNSKPLDKSRPEKRSF